MYNTLVRMWKKGSLTTAQVDRAVEREWITAEQAREIKDMPKDLV